MSYNIAKCRYQKTLENGKQKIINEQYLFDSLSVTEVEARAKEELSALYPDLEVKDVVSTKIAEILGDKECGRFWLVKVNFPVTDEKTGAEKKSVSQILVGATDFTNAVENFNDGMKGTLSDFEVIGISESPIVDYFPAKLSADGE